MRRRYPAHANWIEARFSPGGYLGLHLTIGALVLIAMAWIFGSLAQDVVTRAPIVVVDEKLAHWFNQQGTPAFFSLMKVITFFGSGEWVAAVAVFGGAFLIWKRAWYRLIILLLTLPIGGLLDRLLKLAFERPRPLLARPLLVLDTYSFPSGHTMNATLLYGLAAVLALYHVRTWAGRIGIVAVAGCAMVLVGLSRVALGAHFLTDVLGGFAAGIAWLTLCLTTVETFRRRRLALGLAR